MITSAQHTANPLPLSNKWYYRVLRLLILASFVLAIVGGSEAISGEVAVHKSTGPVLRKVSSVLILVSYVTIVAIQLVYWLNKDLIVPRRKAVRVLMVQDELQRIYILCIVFLVFDRNFSCAAVPGCTNVVFGSVILFGSIIEV